VKRLLVSASLAAGLVLLIGWPVGAEPLPNFTSGYKLPDETYHASQLGESWRFLLDIGLLVVALGLTTFFSLVMHSRKAILLTMLGALFYFGFWRLGCVCSIGAIQNVAAGVFDASLIIPLVVTAFFVLPLVAALFFGRVFCGGACPLGALQDALLFKPIRVPYWLDQGLGMLRHVYLALAVAFVAVGGMYIICRWDPIVSFFRLPQNGWAPSALMMLSVSILVIGFFVGRPYCRYLCPYGALLGVCSRAAPWTAKITPPGQKCIQCQLCEDACPFGAIREPTADLGRDERKAGRRELVLSLVAVVPIIAAFTYSGWLLGPSMATTDNDVWMAEQVRMEMDGEQKRGANDFTKGFWDSKRTPDELFALAERKRDSFQIAMALAGLWIGLVFAGKLVLLTMRRRRVDWEPDPTRCFHCGRCYDSCPPEEGVEEMAESHEQMPRKHAEEEAKKPASVAAAPQGFSV
jgi:polyferredoxin